MSAHPCTPHALAMEAYHRGDRGATIVVHDDFAGREEHPVAYFFREPAAFAEWERIALDACRGWVLDVGAGSGCHTLALLERGVRVTALEIVPELVAIMRERGVPDVRVGSVFDFVDGPFDTVLLMMNGFGLAESLSGLTHLLERFHELVAPNGQVIADSCDLRDRVPRGLSTRADGRYIGEIDFQLEFRGTKGGVFQQLYVDPDTLSAHASATGWSSEILCYSEGGGYLARLRSAS